MATSNIWAAAHLYGWSVRFALIAAALGCAIVALAACEGHTVPAAAPANAHTVQISVSGCGAGWSNPRAGEQLLTLHNTDTRAGEAYLTDAKTGAVYAYVDNLGPNSAADLDINLGSGSFAFRCAMEDESTISGATVVIAGSIAKPTTPVPR